MKFEQAAIPVKDEQGYAQLQALIDAVLGARDAEAFLSRVRRAKLRVRDFDAVLGRGLVGSAAAGLYAALPVSDQALTRERYLQMAEAVPQELRKKYLTVYAYY
jgi:hypothetical protein